MHSGQWEVGSEESPWGGWCTDEPGVPLHSMSWHGMGKRVETEGIKSLAKNDKPWLDVIAQMIWSSLLLLPPNPSNLLSTVISPDF